MRIRKDTKLKRAILILTVLCLAAPSLVLAFGSISNTGDSSTSDMADNLGLSGVSRSESSGASSGNKPSQAGPAPKAAASGKPAGTFLARDFAKDFADLRASAAESLGLMISVTTVVDVPWLCRGVGDLTLKIAYGIKALGEELKRTFVATYDDADLSVRNKLRGWGYDAQNTLDMWSENDQRNRQAIENIKALWRKGDSSSMNGPGQIPPSNPPTPQEFRERQWKWPSKRDSLKADVDAGAARSGGNLGVGGNENGGPC